MTLISPVAELLNQSPEIVASWPDPLPIPSGLEPVPAFDCDLLPDSIRGWVADISERMQCPPDFPAIGAMVALSSVIGRKACIHPKTHDDWQVIPNLWGVLVGRPGAMKSPALSEVLRPLRTLGTEALQTYKEAMEEHNLAEQVQALAADSRNKKAKKTADTDMGEAVRLLRESRKQSVRLIPPSLRRYEVNDSSMEALGETLIENPLGLLVYRDELHGLLRSLDKEGQEGARAFYLQGYDGNQGYTFDRIGRGKNLHIPAVCMSLLGGIQPGKLEAYVREAVQGGSGDDGLLQRFGLLVWPDDSGTWRNVDRWPDSAARDRANAAFRRLDAIQPHRLDDGQTTPVTYHFDSHGQGIFNEWRADLENRLRSRVLQPAMESHLAKYRKLVPALALICTLADEERTIGAIPVQRALAWADYLESHARRAYSSGCRPGMAGVGALLQRIRQGDVRISFRERDVYLKGWSNLSTAKDVKQAAEVLADLDYLRVIDVGGGPQGGRPTRLYLINPKIGGAA